MTHEELVCRAVRWLRSRRRCRVVVWQRTMTWEQPDALGWTAGGASTLVECKASRADFRRDAKKPFRAFPALGMGVYRFYMAPPGLLAADEMPAGWGLLECGPRGVRVARDAVAWLDVHRLNEIQQLVKHGAGWRGRDESQEAGDGSHI